MTSPKTHMQGCKWDLYATGTVRLGRGPAYGRSRPYCGWVRDGVAPSRCGVRGSINFSKLQANSCILLHFKAILCRLQQSVKSTTLCRPMDKINKRILYRPKCCRNNMIKSQKYLDVKNVFYFFYFKIKTRF